MSRVLAQALLAGKGVRHSTDEPGLIETHISYIVLLGEFAYKIKKPLNLGFLDFSTVALRKRCCEDEVRLNSRTAPDIYLEVVPISGSAHEPRLGDATEPFEYAVKMRRFSQDSLLSHLLARDEVSPDIARQLGRMVAEFHSRIAIDAAGSSHGTPDKVLAPAEENFTDLLRYYQGDARLANLRVWTRQQFDQLKDTFLARHEQGFVRECHGDMHLANLLYIDGQCLAFDCLEFNPELRWIDTMAEIAFTIMDLDTSDAHNLAGCFLNSYLEWSGDFEGLLVLRFYLVYRALVRAKVTAIRLGQSDAPDPLLQADVEHHIAVAERYTVLSPPGLILMSGLSGSGKSFVASRLAPRLNAIHVRSDVERKRLHGVKLLADSQGSIYSKAHSDRTFQRLEALVPPITAAGYPVIIDATFIEHHRRQPFIELAARLEIPWLIVECRTDPEIARQRLQSRSGDASEAGIAQYSSQRQVLEPLEGEALTHLLPLDTGGTLDFDTLAETVRRRLGPGQVGN